MPEVQISRIQFGSSIAAPHAEPEFKRNPESLSRAMDELAAHWPVLPIFATRSIAPAALLWLSWWKLSLALMAATMVWSWLRIHRVELRTAILLSLANNILICVAANMVIASAFILAGGISEGVVALLWPAIAWALTRAYQQHSTVPVRVRFGCSPQKASQKKRVFCDMKPDRIEEGRFSEHGRGLGTVTEKMIHNRAREIAVINGRGENHVLDSDREQARRELLGQERVNPAPTAAERLPESERWDPTPGSEGQQAPTMPAPDEQTFAEKLVEEGLEDAEFDRELEASKEALRRDRHS